MSLKIAIFASGSGTNAENIINWFAMSSSFLFPLIVSNKSDAHVHERAKKLNINSVTFSNEEFKTGDAVLDLLKNYEIDHIILAGFLLKIPQSLIQAFPHKIINIHPALLPKYGGKGMYGDRVHQAVIEAKETETGITIHLVNENYDEGTIIYQAKCEVLATDTVEMVATKVHALEYEFYPKVIAELWA